MSLNLNASPYFDDFDPTKNFQRILFKPGVGVQARELTQSQTILQDQISKFGSSIYQQNTPVSGGNVTVTSCYYIKLKVVYNGTAITASDFLGKTIVDPTGNIKAKVVQTSEKVSVSGTVTDYPTLFVQYITSETTPFTDNVTINTLENDLLAASIFGTSSSKVATGKSLIAHISSGVFYVTTDYNISNNNINKIGNFVSVNEQSIVVSKYSVNANVSIGLTVNDSIYTYNDDSTLLDPAVGVSNYQAPGADRYNINLEFSSYIIGNEPTTNFIKLVELNQGSIVKQISTQYSNIDTYFAQRSYDTNGDYVVNNFSLLPTANTIDSSKYDLKIGKGVAYIKGYRVEQQSEVILTGNRARTTQSHLNKAVNTNYENYLFVDTLKGSNTYSFDFTSFPSIDLHCVDKSIIDSNNYNSTLVGTAKLRNLEYNFSTDTQDTTTYTYKAYISDLTTRKITTNVVSATINTIKCYDPNGKFSSSNSAYTNVILSIDSGLTRGETKKVTSYDHITKTLTLDSNLTLIPTNTTIVSLNFGIKDIETVVKVNTSNNVIASANIASVGKTGSLSTGDTVLFNSSKPELLFSLGDSYVNSILNASYTSKKIYTNQIFSNSSGLNTAVSLTLSTDPADTTVFDFSIADISDFIITIKDRKTNTVFNNGDILSLNTNSRSFSVSPDNQTVTFILPDIIATFTADIITRVNVKNANSTKVLKTKKKITASNTTVSILGPDYNDGNTFVDLINGQIYIKKSALSAKGIAQSLLVSDVITIRQIIDTKNPNNPPTVPMLSNPNYDVSSWFSFDNGQRDNYYDYASITSKIGFPTPGGNILVLFDYYSHDNSGDGYFNVMSYLSPQSPNPEDYSFIPTYTAKKSGIVYNLRDCLDFRPSRTNANPTNNTFEYNTGLLFPDSSISYVCDYSFYLPRKDILTLDKDGNFNLIEGSSSQNPQFPQNQNSLTLAQISLDSYTSFLPGEYTNIVSKPNLSIRNVQTKRWTMEDITTLQNRINDLEYYTALNSLEHQSLNSQVPDSLGINRFKNGILVDDFSTTSSLDIYNPDFNCTLNALKKQLTASQDIVNFPLTNPAISTSFVNNNKRIADYAVFDIDGKNIFTLPFTNTIAITQTQASTTTSINPLNTTINAGILNINPPIDNWVDLQVDPVSLNNTTYSLNPLKYGDWKSVIGTSLGTNTQQITQQLKATLNNNNNFNTSLSTIGSTSASSILYGLSVPDYYSYNNNIITNKSIAPYIRHQKLLIQATGLKPNIPINAWFDGKLVNSYMINPDTINLKDVYGTFNKNDIIGYITSENSNFVPIGSVVNTTINNDSSVTLSITGDFYTSYRDFTNPIIAATFDSNGLCNGNTAYGNTASSTVGPISIKTHGSIVSVGGSFKDYLGSSVKFYNVVPTYDDFGRYYGVWSSQTYDAPGSYYSTMPTSVFQFNLPSAGTYYIQFGIDDYEQGTIIIKEIATQNVVYTRYLYTEQQYQGDPKNANSNHFTYIESFSITNPGFYSITFSDFKHWGNGNENLDAYVAVAIAGADPSNPSQSGWVKKGSSDLRTNAIVYFNTRQLNGNGNPPDNTSTQIEMPGGGFYYTGVTSINLDTLASPEDNYYTDTWINITTYFVHLSPNVDKNNQQKVILSKQYHSRRIETYTGSTRTCTFSPGITVSLGGNVLIGGFDISSTYSFNGISSTLYNNSINVIKNGTSTLLTDDKGNYTGIFEIPDSTFLTGQRIFRLDDRSDLTDPNTAQNIAQGTFTAQGLIETVNEINPSVSIDPTSFNFSSSYYSKFVKKFTNLTPITSSNSFDPLAQTFILSSSIYPNGAFLQSIDLFFSQKSSNSSDIVTISIVGTTNGYPNGQTLNYSNVTLSNTAIKTYSTMDNNIQKYPTKFQFPAPVFINTDVLYAIIIQSNSTDYKLYTAENGSYDRNNTTNKKIGYVTGVGSLFESQNGLTWSPNFTKFLMMNVNICKFDNTKKPVIEFSVNKSLPTIRNRSSLIQYAQDVTPYYSSNYPTSIVSDAFNVTTNDMIPTRDTFINYSYISTLKSTQTSYTDEIAINPGKNACPTLEDIYLSDGQGERIILKNINNSFIVKAALSSQSQYVSPVLSDDGLTVYNIAWEINNLELSNTNIQILNNGTNVSNITVSVSAPDLYNGTQAYARANVVNGIVDYIAFPNSGSGYLKAPTFTFNGANSSTISATISSEFSPNGGNALCRYITKKVLLSPGNDSKDLRVFFDAYKPLHTNIHVFCKLLSSGDSNVFENNDWNLLTLVGDNLNNYSKTRDDLYEYEYAPGTGGIADNFITYQGKDPIDATPTQIYDSFIQFAIKIVLTTEDKTTVPYLQNLRVLALPSGTGV